MTVSGRTQKKQRVFKSVFDTEVSQPTPHSTPSLRFPEKGQPFGGPLPGTAHASPGLVSSSNSDLKSSSAQAASSTLTTEQARWDRAWHAVTSRIQLPASVAAEDSFGPLAPESQDLDLDFYDGLRVVLHPAQYARNASYTDDVLSWHTQQVRHHFVQHVLPLLSACDGSALPGDVVSGSIRTLEAAHRQYLYGLSLIMRGMDERMADVAVAKFRRDLHAIISNSMSRALVASVRSELGRFMEVLLKARTQKSSSPSSHSRRSSSAGFRDDAQTHAARRGLLDLVERLHKVGLAGEKFQILFAEMMDELMVEHVKTSFTGLWKRSSSSARTEETSHSSSMRRAARDGTQSPSIASLCDWVENCYARLAVEVLARLDGAEVGWKDLEKWKEIAIGRLAVLRIHELFDIVLHWPASREALDDLRMAVTTPQRRLQLTDTFSAALQKRLLHPGRSTLDILQVYISMIRTFHALDPSKVLLDRVVHSLQLYLCQRDDAIRIVVTGLLSNSDELNAEAGKTKLVELSALLNDPSQQQRQAHEDEELDWDDMKWLPDPVDAGVNYKRPKSEDVIGTLIDALGSQDIFIKEFQNIIAERLLSAQTDFSQEVKVLDLLKRRFGEAALQNCDVMMKDIQDSRRVDTVISRNLKAARSGTADNTKADEAACHAKILSRLFWPALEREHFLLPQPIVDVQKQYDSEFEHLKSSRKLTWLNNLGTASVHLELEDRTVDKECKTYEATVIYAFQIEDGDDGSSAPVQRTVDELYETLQMDDDIIRLALSFWASHRVLRQVAQDTFAVVERLDDDTTEGGYSSTAGVDAPLESAASPVKSGAGGGMDAQEKERRQVYWQFIVGMLTNSAPAMALGQMSMMMKMLVVDGFSWSNEELQEFLGEKMAEGELELAGGKYRLPKK